MARSRQTPPPEPTPSTGSAAPEVATILGTTAVAGAAGAAPAAAGAAGLALTATAVRKASQKIIATLFAWMRSRQAEWIEVLPRQIQQRFPERTMEEINPLIEEERKREREFQRKMRERLERDLPEALRLPDSAEREKRVRTILDRERRYTEQREAAVAERAFTRMEMIDLERVSPLGAFWKLSEGVKQHTVGCLALGNKFWPWSVLRVMHPQLHAGCACHLYTLDEAVERGWMIPGEVPDKADAERRAKDLLDLVHEVYEAVSGEEIAAWLEWLEEGLEGEELEEAARYGMRRAERYAKGTVKGGQFKPRRGAAPARPTLRGKARRLLRRAIPDVPAVPMRSEGVGTWHWISGRFTFVPTERAWEEKIGGNDWTSPAGSGNLYRNGYLVHVPGRKPPHHNDLDRPVAADIRNIPSTPVWSEGTTPPAVDPDIEAAIQDFYNRQRETADRAVSVAIEKGKVPVAVGNDTAIMHEALLANGFSITEVRSISRADAVRGAAALARYQHEKGYVLHVISDQGKIIDWTWDDVLDSDETPAFPDKVETLADLKLAIKAFAHEKAIEFGGTGALVTSLQADHEIEDHAAAYNTAGVIKYGTDTDTTLSQWFRAKKDGTTLGRFDAGALAASLHSLVHEALHAAHPISPGAYAYPDVRAWEEALQEEVARLETPEFLRRVGATEALQFQADFPESAFARGAYGYHRGALDSLLSDAGVAPEERADTIRMLRFEVPRSQRDRWISERLVARAHDEFYPQLTERGLIDDPEEPGRSMAERLESADEMVAARMTASGTDKYRHYYGQRFDPQVAQEITVEASPIMVNGRRLEPGVGVEVEVGLGDDGNPLTKRGTVRALHPTPYEGFDVTVEVAYEDGSADHSVIPSEIARIAPPAASVTFWGEQVSVGDTIRYDGRLDGGMSEAVVERIEKRANGKSMLHARTTADSLKPGQAVLLTEERAGKFEVTGRAPVDPASMTREQFDEVYPSYAWKMGSTGEAARRFDALPDDTEVWLYHGTSSEETARAMAAEGISPEGKPRSLARERYEAGEYAEYQPGAGIGGGLYVSFDPRDVTGYGGWVVAVKVRKGDVVVPPEQQALGETSPGWALFVGDSMVAVPIPPENVRLLGDAARGVPVRDQRIPSHPHDEFVKASLMRSEGIESSGRRGSSGFSFRIPPGVSKEIDMLEGYDSVNTEEDIQYEIDRWNGTRGSADFIRAWKAAEVRADGSRSLNLTPDGAAFFDSILDNAIDIWRDNIEAGYEAQQRAGYVRGAENLRQKIRDARAAVQTEGIDTARLDQEELDLIVSGDHPRVYLGYTDPAGRLRDSGWSEAEVLQVAREYGAALDDYEELLDHPAFHRLMRWTGDDGLAEIVRSGWHRSRENRNLPKRIGMSLLKDESVERDGWGVTNTGAATARVDSRRPGVRTADVGGEDFAFVWAADPRYTAIHEAHHMHGSNSEFDAGSEVAFAYHVDKRGLSGPGPDSIKPEIVNRLMRGTGINSRASQAIRAIFGDDKLDEWAQLPNSIYRDPFERRKPAPVDTSIAGRVRDLNVMDATPSEKRAWLEQHRLIEATEFYGDRVEAGEQVWMRANGESLALDSDGHARVLDDGTVTDAVRSEGVDPLRLALQEAGFRSPEEAFQETEFLARWPAYRDMPDQELLDVRARLNQRLNGNSLAGYAGMRAAERESIRSGAPWGQGDAEALADAEARYAAVNHTIALRQASANHARQQEALRLADERGVPVIDRQDYIELLANAGDVYVDAGMKPPFDYNPDYFITSDLSGKPIRHYVTLPDGRKAHPDELHDARARGRLVVVDRVVAPRDRPRYRSEALPESVLAELVPETHRVLPSGRVYGDQEVDDVVRSEGIGGGKLAKLTALYDSHASTLRMIREVGSDEETLGLLHLHFGIAKGEIRRALEELNSPPKTYTDNLRDSLAALREQIGLAERRRPRTTAGGNFEAEKAAQLERFRVKEERLLAQIAKAEADETVRSEGIDMPVSEINLEPRYLAAYEARRAVREAEVEQSNLRDFDKPDGEQSAEYHMAGEVVGQRQAELLELERAAGGRVFLLDDMQFARGESKIKDLGKRATKLKLDPPTMRTVGEEWVPTKPKSALGDGEGTKDWRAWPRVHRQYVIVEGAEPKLAGWEFIATLQHLDGANVIRRVPGSDEQFSLERYRSGDATCDYCKTKRDRKDTFVVKNDEGKVQQIGRSCLKDFLGHGDPTQIAAYLEHWALLDDLDREFDDDMGGGYAPLGNPPVETFLAHVVKKVNEEGWVSRSAGMGMATADAAYEDWRKLVTGKVSRGEKVPDPPSDADYARAKEVLTWLREDLARQERLSDFDHNMVAMSAGEIVPEKGTGILAYTVVAHAKAMEREILRKERDRANADLAETSTHVGSVGDRLDLDLKVTSVFPREGDYGVTYITKLLDDKGNVFTWFGSYEMEQGATYRGKWGVKKHDEFKGVKQTVLTRPTKVEMVEDASGATGIPEGWEVADATDLMPGDDVLLLMGGKRKDEERFAKPNENALEGHGGKVMAGDDGLQVATLYGPVPVPTDGQVIRRSRVDRTLDGKTIPEWEAERVALVKEFGDKVSTMTEEEKAAYIERGAQIIANIRRLQVDDKADRGIVRSEGIERPDSAPEPPKLSKVAVGWYASEDGTWAVIGDDPGSVSTKGESEGKSYDQAIGVATGTATQREWQVVHDPQGRLREDPNAGTSFGWSDTLKQGRAEFERRWRRTQEVRTEGIEPIPVHVPPHVGRVRAALEPLMGEKLRVSYGHRQQVGTLNQHPYRADTLRVDSKWIEERFVEKIEVKRGSRYETVADFGTPDPYEGLIARSEGIEPVIEVVAWDGSRAETTDYLAAIRAGAQLWDEAVESRAPGKGVNFIVNGEIVRSVLDRSMLVQPEVRSERIEVLPSGVLAYRGDRHVGTLTYTDEGEGARVLVAHVTPEMRRQGIATRMLDALKAAKQGPVVVDDSVLSDDGAAWGDTVRSEGIEHPHSPRRFERVSFQGEGQDRPTSVILEVTSEDDSFLRGYEVNRRGERVAPKRGDAPAADERLHVIDLEAIRERAPLRLNLRYEEFEDVPVVPPEEPVSVAGYPPLPESPPTFKLISPGLYESPDGRLELMRLLSSNPPAWNVTFTVDYYNALVNRDPEGFDYFEFGNLIVDGAASKRDALAILAEEWPSVLERVAKYEAPVVRRERDDSDPDFVFSDVIEMPPGNVASWTRTPSFVDPKPGPEVGIRFHRGGDGVSETIKDQMYGRGTGHFGTGIYFASGQENVSVLADTDKRYRQGQGGYVGVPLAGKNLYRPRDAEDAFRLHDGLSYVNALVNIDTDTNGWVYDRYHAGMSLFSIGMRVPSHSADGRFVDFDERERLIKESVLATRADKDEGRTDRDYASTRLMKRLGYDGVDTRHLPRLDNTEYGSVLYREDVVPAPLSIEDVVRSEGIAPPGRVTRAELDMLLDLPIPNERKRIVGSITYTPKLKRPATAKGFETRGQLWLGPSFFTLEREEREEYLGKEFAEQFSSVGNSYRYAEIVYPNPDRDLSTLDRETVELALRHGFPVAEEVERWATGKSGTPPITAAPTPDPVKVEEDLALDADFLAMIEKFRSSFNLNLIDNLLTDSIKLGGPKLGFSRVGGIARDRRIYRNYDTGVTVVVHPESEGIEAYRTATLPTAGIASEIIGVPGVTAEAMLNEAGYFPGSWRTNDYNWRRWAHRNGDGLLIKTTRRGHEKVVMAYPEPPSDDEVKQAAVMFVQSDPYGGIRIGTEMEDAFEGINEFDSGWSSGDFARDGDALVYTMVNDSDERLPFRFRIVDERVTEIGRPDPDDPTRIVDDDAYRLALEAKALEREQLAAQGPDGWARSLIGLRKRDLYSREEFQSRGLGVPYFDKVDGNPNGGGPMLFANHDTGVTLLLDSDEDGVITEATATQSAQSTQHPIVQRMLALAEAGHFSFDQAQMELGGANGAWQSMRHSEGDSWYRFVNATTGESIIGKFDRRGDKPGWNEHGLSTAYYEQTTPSVLLGRAKSAFLKADPVGRITPGMSILEVRALKLDASAAYLERRDSVGEYDEFLAPWPGSARRIRVAHKDGVVTRVGFKPPGDIVAESDTRILTDTEFLAEQKAKLDALTAAKQAAQREAEAKLEHRKEALARRESPVEVGEPSSAAIKEVQALGFSLQSRKRVRWSKKEWPKRLEAEARARAAQRNEPYEAPTEWQLSRPGMKGYSYVYRNTDGHTLRIVTASAVPEPGDLLGMQAPNRGFVHTVEWTPALQVDRQRVQGRVGAASVEEMVADALGRTDELGERYGASVDIPTVKHTSSKSDHSGHHEWNGTVVLGRAAWPSMKALYAKQQSGEPITSSEARDAWSAWSLLQHEINHGVNPLRSAQYGKGSPEVAMEESLTEEATQPLTVEWFKEMGGVGEEVLGWVKSNPRSTEVLGSYQRYRQQLARAFDEAGVAQEDRRDMIMRMKFQMTQPERFEYLGSLLAAHQGLDPVEGYRKLRGIMAPARRGRYGGMPLGEFTGIIDISPDLEGITRRAGEVQVANGVIKTGVNVVVEGIPPRPITDPYRVREISADGSKVALIRKVSFDQGKGKWTEEGPEWVDTDAVRVAPIRFGQDAEDKLRKQRDDDPTIDVGDEVVLWHGKVGEVEEIVPGTLPSEEDLVRVAVEPDDDDDPEEGKLVLTYRASQVLARTDTPIHTFSDPTPFEHQGQVLYPGMKLIGKPVPLTGTSDSGRWQGDRSREYEFVVVADNYAPDGSGARHVTGIIRDPESGDPVALNFPLAGARFLTKTHVSA